MTTPVSWWRIGVGEEEAGRVAQAIRDEHLSQGPIAAEFEHRLAEFLGVPYVVATTSGSMALLIALWSIGVESGDEIIVPNRTWIATAHAAVLLGAKVKLVDVDARRSLIDPAAVEAAITDRTKAIIPVHLNGRGADMSAIREIAARRGVRVIEDAAQALGSHNAAGWLGTQSDIGCFSLSVAKIITTGQGGFVATRDKALYDRLLAIRTHGVASVIDAVWMQPGFNFRFTDILAAIGLVQLTQLDERIKQVKSIYLRYARALAGHTSIELIPSDLAAGEVPVYAEVLFAERERLIAHLAGHGIQSRPFYPDLDTAEYLRSDRDFPNSRRFGRDALCLPCGPGQSEANIDRTIDVLLRFR